MQSGFLFGLDPIFVFKRRQDRLAPRVGHIAMAKLVVALPEAVGTRSVEILQSYTRGFRAPRLAKVRPQTITVFICATITPNRLCYASEPDDTVPSLISPIYFMTFHIYTINIIGYQAKITTPAGIHIGSIYITIYLHYSFASKSMFVLCLRQLSFVPIVGLSRKLAHAVVALPVAVGTKNVAIQKI